MSGAHESEAPLRSAWLAANAAGAALCLIGLAAWQGGALDGGGPVTLFDDQVLLPGLAWGIFQWLALRRAGRRPRILWPLITPLSWLLGLAVATLALGSGPGQPASLQDWAAALDLRRQPPLWPPNQAALALIWHIAFGLFSGLVLGLGPALALLLNWHGRTLAGAWFLRTALGWLVGTVVGAVIAYSLLLAGGLAPGPGFPRWLTTGLVGGSAGAGLGLLTRYLLPPETTGEAV